MCALDDEHAAGVFDFDSNLSKGKNLSHPKGWLKFLAELERFELSRSF